MDVAEDTGVTVGERLRAAREEKGMTLEDLAAQTRIPRRHLESLEASEWEKLPAPTYTIGFARSYASSVGLDRTEIADQLRAEMGGSRPATAANAESFQPADPARTMPKGLVLGAIAAVLVLLLLMSWFNSRSLDSPGTAQDAAAPPIGAPAAPAPPPAAPGQSAEQGPVALTATAEVWVSISDAGRTLKEGIMQPGERFEVPASAQSPTLTTGKAEALRITVGTGVAPQVGPPAARVSNVSLRAADLMRAQPAAGAAPPAAGALGE